MSIHLRLTNFNKLVHQVQGQPVVLNDLQSVTKEDRLRIESLTTSVFRQTDVYSNEPQCECGTTTGGYNKGVVCPVCRQPVTELFSKELMPRVWLRNPAGVSLLINPLMWTMLSKEFTISGFNVIEWLCNTDYVPPGSVPADVLEQIRLLGIQRGYNYFVDNFDHVLPALWSIGVFAKKKDPNLAKLIADQREAIFSEYLPLPNKAMLIREDTNVGPFIDRMLRSIIDAIQMIRSIDTNTAQFSLRQRENRTVKTIVQLAAFYFDSYHQVFAKKAGLIRRNIAGQRCFWSARAVITSNTKPHVYDELELPWGQAVTLLTVHLKNKLMRLGFNPNEAAAFLYHHTSEYNALLDSLMQMIIEETPNQRGLYCIFVRNPSLSRGSTQRFRITKIKTDPNDQTISLPILSVKAFNADFDGDQMSLMLMLDNFMADQIEALAPHKNILDPNQPRGLTNVADMPKPVASTINNWISVKAPEQSADPAKMEFMLSLAD